MAAGNLFDTELSRVDRVLVDKGDLVTRPRQNDGGKRAAQAGADDRDVRALEGAGWGCRLTMSICHVRNQ